MSKKKPAAANTAAETTANTAAETTADTAAVQPVQLTVSDLQLLGQIIDLASRRGAFQAHELAQVGTAYNKLAAFLSYVEATTKKEPGADGVDEKSEAAE